MLRVLGRCVLVGLGAGVGEMRACHGVARREILRLNPLVGQGRHDEIGCHVGQM